MTTLLRRTSSAALSVSWSTSSTTPQGLQHRTTSLPISKPFTIPSAPILFSAGVRLQVLKLNLLLPPPDRSTLYLCILFSFFILFSVRFWGEGLKKVEKRIRDTKMPSEKLTVFQRAFSCPYVWSNPRSYQSGIKSAHRIQNIA